MVKYIQVDHEKRVMNLVDKQLLKEVLDQALQKGGDFGDIFLEHKKTTAIRCEAGRIEKIQTGVDIGAGLRVISGEATAYAYTNDLSRESLLNVAGIVSHAAATGKKNVNLNFTEVQPLVEFNFTQRPGDVSTDRKVAVVEAAEQAARTVDPARIKQVIVGYGDLVQQVTIANSEGDFVEDERVRTRLVVQAIAASGAAMQTGYEAVGSLSGSELFATEQPDLIGEAAARQAVNMLEAQPAPAGRMPVVIAGEAGGTMVHEACGHGLEADLVQKGLSVYANKKGQVVAADVVSVVEDPTLNVRYGSYRFDDEGVPSRKVTLIENGVLNGYMYDRLTATKDGVNSNGHGRRESYQHKPIPRMGNTFIAPGKTDPAKILRETGTGLLVKKMGGGQVNTTTGDFVFDVAEGYLIKDGEAGPMVRGATLTGNGPEVLRIVEMVGSDLGFTIGTCGKDGQGVPVSDAQPTIAIKQLIVGGTATGPANGKIMRI